MEGIGIIIGALFDAFKFLVVLFWPVIKIALIFTAIMILIGITKGIFKEKKTSKKKK